MIQLTGLSRKNYARLKGMALIEFVASLMIGSFMLAGIVGLVNWYLDTIKQNSAADYQANVAKAAESYIKENYSDLLTDMQTKGNALAIDLQTMQQKGYGVNISPSNIYGNTPCLLIGKQDFGSSTKIVSLLVSAGGQAIPEIDLGMIASSSGTGAGFIPDKRALAMAKEKFTDEDSLKNEAGYKHLGPLEATTTDVAYGPFSGWALSTRYFQGKDCGSKNFKSRLASLIRVDDSSLDPDFLSRVAGGDASTMKTDLNMNNNKILDVNNFSADYLKILQAKNADSGCLNMKAGSIFYDKDRQGVVFCKDGAGSALGYEISKYINMESGPRTLTWRESSGKKNATQYCRPNEIIEFVRTSCSQYSDNSGFLYPKDSEGPVTRPKALISLNYYKENDTSNKANDGGPGWCGNSAETVAKGGAVGKCTWGVHMDQNFDGSKAKMGVAYGYYNEGYGGKQHRQWAAAIKGVYVEGWTVDCGSVHAYVGVACRLVGDAIEDTTIDIDTSSGANSYDPTNSAITALMPDPDKTGKYPASALPDNGIIVP